VEQRCLPRVGDAAALVVDEAVVGRAARRHQPTNRQFRIDDDVGDLKRGAGLRDGECLAAEQSLKGVPDAERHSSDGRDDSEPLVLHVSTERHGQGHAGRGLAAGNHRDKRPPPITQRSRLELIETPCGTKVLPMSLEWSITHP
jgi:hypothetical protein